MASSNDNVSMALFCDFENVALGVRDANYDKFDIKPVLERLLLKGSIVVKKAYCDWDRYKGFKAPMHEANFELIEIPHVRQSGKNSADIRMVVDALDLCYTKSHVDTFVIISGDSDFSPLVSKLRENAKKVIGVGVKQSTSDLLVANCDEFIFYDDLVRESRRARRDAGEAKPAVKRSPEEENARRDEMEKRRDQAVEIAVNTFEALVLERGDSGKIWASVLKEAIKRRKPDFSESYYGFRTFGNLIEECKARGLLEFGRDEKSGAYVYRSSGAQNSSAQARAEGQSGENSHNGQNENGGNDAPEQGNESRRSRNRGRTAAERFAERQAERHGRQGQGRTGHADDNQGAIAIAIDTTPETDAIVPAEPLAELADAAQAAANAGTAAAPAASNDRDGNRNRNRGGRDRNNRNDRGDRNDRNGGGQRNQPDQPRHQAGEVEVQVAAPVVLEAAVELPVVQDAPVVSGEGPGQVQPQAPAKKKSGAKPPARKVKAAAKAPAVHTEQAMANTPAAQAEQGVANTPAAPVAAQVVAPAAQKAAPVAAQVVTPAGQEATPGVAQADTPVAPTAETGGVGANARPARPAKPKAKPKAKPAAERANGAAAAVAQPAAIAAEATAGAAAAGNASPAAKAPKQPRAPKAPRVPKASKAPATEE